MDRETVDEIKRHFSIVATGLQGQISDLQEQVGGLQGLQGQISNLQEQVGGLQGLQGQMGGLREQIGGLEGTVTGLRQQIVASSEETKRHCGVLVEDLRADMRLIAEGQGHLREDLEGLAQIVQLTHSELTGRLNDHETRLSAVERKL